MDRLWSCNIRKLKKCNFNFGVERHQGGCRSTPVWNRNSGSFWVGLFSGLVDVALVRELKRCSRIVLSFCDLEKRMRRFRGVLERLESFWCFWALIVCCSSSLSFPKSKSRWVCVCRSGFFRSVICDWYFDVFLMIREFLGWFSCCYVSLIAFCVECFMFPVFSCWSVAFGVVMSKGYHRHHVGSVSHSGLNQLKIGNVV